MFMPAYCSVINAWHLWSWASGHSLYFNVYVFTHHTIFFFSLINIIYGNLTLQSLQNKGPTVQPEMKWFSQGHSSTLHTSADVHSAIKSYLAEVITARCVSREYRLIFWAEHKADVAVRSIFSLSGENLCRGLNIRWAYLPIRAGVCCRNHPEVRPGCAWRW